jgi:hypothetical protein
MRTPRLSDERGIALAIAVFALVIIGALVAGTFYAARLEQRTGQNGMYAQQAFEAAEAGMAAVMETNAWDNEIYQSYAVNVPQTLTTVTSGSMRYTPIVTHLNDYIYLVEARGERVDAGGRILARRLLGTIGRIDPTSIDIQAALTSGGAVNVGGSSAVDGADHIPDGWGGVCDAVGDPLAGVRTDADVSVYGSASVAGDPPELEGDATVVDSIFTNPFEELKAVRDKNLGVMTWNGMMPALTATIPLRCNKTLDSNWGEPWFDPPMVGVISQCQSYFPIIYRNGNLRVQNGRGQGIILVEGNFEVRGNFEFNGIVIVRGELSTQGTGNKITGAVLAQNAELGDETTIIGNPVINYSACAVERALVGNAKLKPLVERSWAQLYN